MGQYITGYNASEILVVKYWYCNILNIILLFTIKSGP